MRMSSTGGSILLLLYYNIVRITRAESNLLRESWRWDSAGHLLYLPPVQTPWSGALNSSGH